MKLKSQKNHQIYTTKTQIITIKLHPVIDEIYFYKSTIQYRH